jgi:hypothetical protein
MSNFKTRRITEEQFANSTTIDGTRLQKALDETEEYINNIPIEAVKQRYSLNYMVFTSLGADWAGAAGKFTGDVIGNSRMQPFLKESTAAGYRVKGTSRRSYDHPNMPGAVPYIWTISTVFPQPVILDNVTLFINGDGARSGSAPTLVGNKHSFDMWDSTGECYQRVRVIIDTDDAVSAEDRSLNSKEFVLEDFQETFWSGNHNSTGSNMMPASPEGTAVISSWGTDNLSHSLYLNKHNINIPIHQFARVRFRVIKYVDLNNADPLKTATPENITFTVVYKQALKDG